MNQSAIKNNSLCFSLSKSNFFLRQNESDEKTIVVRSEGEISLLLLESLKEKFGDKINVVSLQQAIENQALPSSIEIDEFKVVARPSFEEFEPILSGKEKRRVRRLKQK